MIRVKDGGRELGCWILILSVTPRVTVTVFDFEMPLEISLSRVPALATGHATAMGLVFDLGS